MKYSDIYKYCCKQATTGEIDAEIGARAMIVSSKYNARRITMANFDIKK